MENQHTALDIVQAAFDTWIDKLKTPLSLQISHPGRFGQFFCNTFNITDPALFYEEDAKVAFEMALAIAEKKIKDNERKEQQ